MKKRRGLVNRGELGVAIMAALLMSVLALFCAAPATAFEKAIPLHIVPYGDSAARVNFVYTRHEVPQYNGAGVSTGSSENQIFSSKWQLCYSPLPGLEIGAEAIYLHERIQKRSSSAGETLSRSRDQGPGDISLHLSWLLRDSRVQRWGLLLGGEVKLPTADVVQGMSGSSLDLVARTTLSGQYGPGFPYLAVVYTLVGSGPLTSGSTENPDDLCLATGFRSRSHQGVSVDARLFYYHFFGDSSRIKDGHLIREEQPDLKGVRLELRYQFSRALEFTLFREETRYQASTLTSDGALFSKGASNKHRTGLTLRYLW